MNQYLRNSWQINFTYNISQPLPTQLRYTAILKGFFITRKSHLAPGSIYAQYKVYELAAQHGIKVLLDGQGADEILAGYHKYYKWYWQELFRKRKLISTGELNAAKQLGIT
jgi:asparagine synthetase B (glutamine-hydrolysing)